MSAASLFPLRLLVLVTALVALSSIHIPHARAQQSGSPQTPDSQGKGNDAAKSPSASDAQPGSAAQPPKDAQPQKNAQPQKDAQPAKEPGAGIPALVVDGDQMLGVLGKQVRSSAGEDMGRIVDVIIDKTVRVRGVVIDFGGFLGVGNRQIAVAWNALRPPAQNKPGPLVVDFTRDQLRVAPAYKAGEQVVLLGPPDAPPAPTPPAAPAAPPTGGAADKDAPAKDPPAKEPPSK